MRCGETGCGDAHFLQIKGMWAIVTVLTEGGDLSGLLLG